MLKIVFAQMPVISANPKKNFANMVLSIEYAKKNKAHIILFPEMCLPGYFNGDLWEQKAFLQECEYFHEKIKMLSQNCLIIFGSVGSDWSQKNEDGRVRKYNAAYCAYNENFIINSKTKLFYWPKTLHPNYREFDDSRHFYDLRKLAFEKNCSLHELYEPVQFLYEDRKISIGISICEDAWSENYAFSPVEIFNKNYAHDFFVNLSCSPFGPGKKNRREIIFSNLAKSIKLPIFYINCTGSQNIGKTIYGFDGGSALYNIDGSVQEVNESFNEKPKMLEYTVASINSLIVKKNLSRTTQHLQGIAEIQQALEYTTQKICTQWNIKKAVIGISGGIDSALSATLMTRILGKENIFLINMPSKFNSTLTINAAKKLAENLDCAYTSIGIMKSIHQTQSQLSQICFENSGQSIKVTPFILENIQARDRGARILAAIAAAVEGVFTCNANKTELTVGYGTLYGDIAGFLCPIADLWKHQVYALTKFYNEVIFKKEIIPKATLEVVPSAELSHEQNVIAGKGDPLIYPYHDYLFCSWVEHWERKTPEDCLKAYIENKLDEMIGCQPGLSKQLFPTKDLFCEDIERWWKLYQGLGAVKRMQAPPIVALSRRAFGYDHREHLGNPILTEKYFELRDL